jgi:hypothetical protein
VPIRIDKVPLGENVRGGGRPCRAKIQTAAGDFYCKMLKINDHPAIPHIQFNDNKIHTGPCDDNFALPSTKLSYFCPP